MENKWTIAFIRIELFQTLNIIVIIKPSKGKA